ncbi:30S ribosomal protein S20 [bacterium]|nr:30S ribosomal protein S20 [bacterium]
MANHKSALKRIRANEEKRLRNRYQHKTMRNALRDVRKGTDAAAVKEQLPKVYSMIDRLVKNNIIHKNKAANLKSSIAKHLNSLATA